MEGINYKSEIDELRQTIRERYARLVSKPKEHFHYLRGRRLAKWLDYPEGTINMIPEDSVNAFSGVGNPFSILPFDRGMTIVDIGCGAGMDSCIAALLAGSRGRVLGLDMTPEMVSTANETGESMRLLNAAFIEGYAEEIPLPANSVDLVMSNGVIHLCPDKVKVYKEIYRILKPGGRIQMADIIADREDPVLSANDMQLWADSITGGISIKAYNDVLKQAGFVNIAIGKEMDLFAGARIESKARRRNARSSHVFACK